MLQQKEYYLYILWLLGVGMNMCIASFASWTHIFICFADRTQDLLLH